LFLAVTKDTVITGYWGSWSTFAILALARFCAGVAIVTNDVDWFMKTFAGIGTYGLSACITVVTASFSWSLAFRGMHLGGDTPIYCGDTACHEITCRKTIARE